VLWLAGTAHSGKTTTLSKLMLRLLRAGRRITVASAAARRPWSRDALLELAQQAGLKPHNLRKPADVKQIALDGQAADLLLIEGSGDAKRDRKLLEGLALELLRETERRTSTCTWCSRLMPARPKRWRHSRRMRI